jgi:hypothetical protein
MNKRIRRKKVRQMLLEELSIRFEDTNDAITWLDTPLAHFEGRSPREAIAAGEAHRVTMLLDELNTKDHQQES